MVMGRKRGRPPKVAASSSNRAVPDSPSSSSCSSSSSSSSSHLTPSQTETAMLLALRTGGHLGWGKPKDEPWWPCIAARSYTVLHHFTSTQEPRVPLGKGRVLAYFLGDDTYDILDEGWFEVGYILRKPTKTQIVARPEYAEGTVVGDKLLARIEALDEEEGMKLRGLLSRGVGRMVQVYVEGKQAAETGAAGGGGEKGDEGDELGSPACFMADTWWPAIAVDSWEVGERARLGLAIPQRELSRGEALVFKLGSWVPPSERWDVVRRCSPYGSSSSSSSSGGGGGGGGRMLGAGEGGDFNKCMLEAAKTEAKALVAPPMNGETRRSRMGRGFVFSKGEEEEEEEGGGEDVESMMEGKRQRGKRKGGGEEMGEEKKEKVEMDVKKPMLTIRFKTTSSGAAAAAAAAPPPSLPAVPLKKRHKGCPPTRGGEALFKNKEEEVEEEKEDEDKGNVTSKIKNRLLADPPSISTTTTCQSLPPSRPFTPEEVEKIRRLAEGLLFMDEIDRVQSGRSLRHDLNALRLFIRRGKEMTQYHLMRLEMGLRAYVGRMRAQLLRAKREFGRWEQKGRDGRRGGRQERKGVYDAMEVTIRKARRSLEGQQRELLMLQRGVGGGKGEGGEGAQERQQEEGRALEDVQTALDALTRLQRTLRKTRQQQQQEEQQQRDTVPLDALPHEGEEGGTEEQKEEGMKIRAAALFRVGKEVTEDQIAAAEHLLRACEGFRQRLLRKVQRQQQQQRRQQRQQRGDKRGGGRRGGEREEVNRRKSLAAQKNFFGKECWSPVY